MRRVKRRNRAQVHPDTGRETSAAIDWGIGSMIRAYARINNCRSDKGWTGGGLTPSERV